MPRKVPTKKPFKGSQRWLQFFVNEQPDLLNHAVRRAATIAPDVQITWQSPLTNDEFAEYSDQAFLDRLGLSTLKVPLSKFWPSNGAHWDALATTSADDVILVEAKAHITEFATDPTDASSQESLRLIHKSLGEVQRFMKVSKIRCRPELWANAFYQYANRIAHLYSLRELNDIPAHLVFVDFVNDPDSGQDVVRSASEWQSLVRLAEACLGIRQRNNPLMNHAQHIHLDVGDLGDAL